MQKSSNGQFSHGKRLQYQRILNKASKKMATSFGGYHDLHRGLSRKILSRNVTIKVENINCVLFLHVLLTLKTIGEERGLGRGLGLIWKKSNTMSYLKLKRCLI